MELTQDEIDALNALGGDGASLPVELFPEATDKPAAPKRRSFLDRVLARFRSVEEEEDEEQPEPVRKRRSLLEKIRGGGGAAGGAGEEQPLEAEEAQIALQVNLLK